jgi:hypothetical protein
MRWRRGQLRPVRPVKPAQNDQVGIVSDVPESGFVSLTDDDLGQLVRLPPLMWGFGYRFLGRPDNANRYKIQIHVVHTLKEDNREPGG